MKRLRSLLLFALCAASPIALAVSPGDAAPAFTLPDASGLSVDSAKLRGKVIYVDFWASWCAPCRRSFPWMNEMTQKYGAKGLAVVAINLDKKRDDADKFLRHTPAAFTVLYDAAGTTPANWQVKGMPSSYLVDTAGKVVLRESGFKDERKAEIEEKIRAALGLR